jgi:signal transduction histidine kinase
MRILMQKMAVPVDLATRGGGDTGGSDGPTRVRRRSPLRGGLVLFGPRGWAAIAFLSASQVLLVGLAASSVDAPSKLLAVSALAQAPILIGAAAAAVISDRRQARRRADLRELMTLASRIELSESILAREQERMHELRTTVTSVALSQRLLTHDRATLSRATRWRLERLTEAELARIERLLSDTRRDPVAPVDLSSVLDPLVDAMRLCGHAVLWKGTRCRALGRADDIAEIVHILLDNAARHAGGRRVALEVADCGELIELRVSDDGPGVPAALAAVLFERGTRTGTSRGEGIGLHIARRLARDLGGDLWLEPVPAATGAVFVLQLPDTTGDAPCLEAAV